MNGALLENYTVSEIMKSYQNAGLEPYIYFYRDRDAKEIDVLLENVGKLFPLEIKKTVSPDQRLTRVFSIIDKSPLQVGTGAILYMAARLSAFDRDNLIVPIWLIWMEKETDDEQFFVKTVHHPKISCVLKIICYSFFFKSICKAYQKKYHSKLSYSLPTNKLCRRSHQYCEPKANRHLPVELFYKNHSPDHR